MNRLIYNYTQLSVSVREAKLIEKTTSLIPTIEFNKKDSSSASIEVIELQSIYNRLPTLDHNPADPHRLDFYVLIYITQGIGSHFIDFKYHPYEAGSFIFINKNQINAFDLENKPKGNAVFFTQGFADEISTNLRIPLFSLNYLLDIYSPVFTVNSSLKETSEALLLEITKESIHPNADRFVTQLLFSTLLIKLMRERPQEKYDVLNERQIKKITRFLCLVENHFQLNRNVAFYADKMAMSYKQLNLLCKLASQRSAKQLIDSYIIVEAKRKLVIEQSSIKEISYELGFEEISNFIKFFKKHTFLTPNKFKKINKG